MDTLTVILLALGSAAVAALVTGLLVHRRLHRKVTFMLDALEDGESAFRYRESKWLGGRFNRTLNRLHGIFDAEVKALREQDAHYGKMLDGIRTGILVYDSTEKGEGRVIYANAAATQMLGLPSISHLRQLSIVSPQLMEAFRNASANKEVRATFNNERNKVTVSMTATQSTIGGKSVRIVAFNDITGDIAHNEEISWNKLIRVLTHEIMNTVTPIASLSDTLSKDLSNILSKDPSATISKDASDIISKDLSETNVPMDARKSLSLEELQRGLETISTSSKGLIKFVDTYRNLTRVATPVKKAFYVRELVERVRVLTADKVAESGASFIYEEKSDDILIYADASQISQIMVNLVKNAIQAGASVVRIEASIDWSEKVVIRISNNGTTIPPEAADQIFVPFYTTKPDGSGIGLSLSRQIMRLHNGTITLERSDEKMTTFVMEFK